MSTVAIFLILLLAGFIFPGRATAVDQITIGGSGLPWEDNSIIFNALEEVDSSLLPLEADPEENILPRIKELGGSAETSVLTAAARSNQILNELTDEDYTTGWRVYTNTNGAELTVDMGAIFVLQRLFLRRGVITSDKRSLRGYEFYINDGDSLNFVGSEPAYVLVTQDRSHGEPELDISFPAQEVRFFKIRSTGERSFQMGDLEVFGIGVTPLAHYVSRVIDLGAPANFGPVHVAARINSRARTLLSTKTGIVPDDSLYFRQTGIPGEFEEIPKDQFDRTLDPSYAGEVRENDRDWSAWSPSYASLENVPLSSPDNRRYLQLELRLVSEGLLDKAIIDSVTFSYTTPAIADSVVAEISPVTAAIGEVNRFAYHLRSVLTGNKRGFDTVFINTPFAAAVTAVEVDNTPISDYDWEMVDNSLKVVFANDRVETSGRQVTVHFESLMTVSGTEFRGQVGDSRSDAFPQRIIAGDANPDEEANSLIVSGQIEDRLFSNVRFSSSAITPNGDGSNDLLELDYILLKATSPVDIEVVVHNLRGEVVRRVYGERDLSGPNRVVWNGRDAAGDMVPPGLYLIRLQADTDAGKNTEIRPIAVAY